MHFTTLLPFLTIATARPYHPSLPLSGAAITTRYIVRLTPNTSLATHALRINTLAPRSVHLARRSRHSTSSTTPNNNASSVSFDSIGIPTPVDRSFRIAEFQCYVGSFLAEDAEAIGKMDEVLSIEPDIIYTLATVSQDIANEALPSPSTRRQTDNLGTLFAAANRTAQSSPLLSHHINITASRTFTQSAAPWHLADISHKTANQSTYLFPASAGNGSRVYIVDSGIRRSHSEFNGRVEWGWNAVEGTDRDPGAESADINGHGTHIAGLVGGMTYGVAKEATLVDVKVFDYSTTSMSAILSGLEWATTDILSRNATANSIINLSLSSSQPQSNTSALPNALEAALTAISRHILITIPAGNTDSPASAVTSATLARSSGILTVGMTDTSRMRPWFSAGSRGSSYGEHADVYAPGANVVSASFQSDEGALMMSGTSMAAGIAAGVAAVFMGDAAAGTNGGIGSGGPHVVKEKIKSVALRNIVGSDGDNGTGLLVYNGIGE